MPSAFKGFPSPPLTAPRYPSQELRLSFSPADSDKGILERVGQTLSRKTAFPLSTAYGQDPRACT